ncbi:undecaprenyl/decaprenyl-phosphate alpha-N-acetylglucosaminyl 1-phosphate transferase [Gammaproteobacteria bacterium]|nr:undecaprenyl/decaprenyl-phosphate alpha-N-acetylglucosaminyl 1-phosphate transferase [Gammaproteobacteria bacterium]
MILGLIGLIVLLIISSNLARKINLVDISNEPRKKHVGTIPLVGGIGLFISFIYGAFVFGANIFYIYLIGSLIPIMLVGIVDSIHGISVRPVYRIIAQIISSWIIITTTDIYLKDLGDLFGFGDIYIGTLGIPFTIFAVVGICNAFNMLDGKDGLLGSVSAIIMFSLLMLLYLNGIIYEWGQIVLLSLLVYLAFNLNLFGQKRKIFLGDHGSTGLGHIIAWSLVFLSQETQFITPISAIWFVILPLTDAILTFIRRSKSSRSIFKADTLHFHHKLAEVGLSDRLILLIISIITLVSCSFAVIANVYNIKEYLLLYSYLTIVFSLVLLGFSIPQKDK